MHRPSRLSYTKGNTTLFDTGVFQYDGGGNIYKIGDNLYRYDATSRLTYADVTLISGSQWETYAYDPFDNLTEAQKEDQSIPVQSLVDQSTNRYTGGGVPFEYDSTGNLTKVVTNATLSMAWDAFDMQREFSDGVDTYRYIYGPGDYRIVSLEKTHATVDLRDTDGTLLRQYTLTGNGTGTGTGSPEDWSSWKHEKDFIYGPDGLLLSLTRTGTAHYSHKDHLGSVRAISDAGGVVRGEHSFYPFGQEAGRTGQVDEPAVKFTGHMRDAHELSDYMLGRTCLWPLRRFASVDPGRDGWNLYAYVGNNPIRFVDPDGWLQRDANGELIAKLGGLSGRKEKRLDGGRARRVFVVQDVTLTANDGRPIKAHTVLSGTPKVGDILYDDGTRTSDPTTTNPMCSDCHGMTFADGKYWIENNQIDSLLEGDGYEKIEGAAQVGDVVIYRNQGQVIHSATVTKVSDQGQVLMVKSLAGTAILPTEQTMGPGPGSAWSFTPAVTEIYREPQQ